MDRTERHTNYPNVVRTIALLHYLFAIFHWNACLVYVVQDSITSTNLNNASSLNKMENNHLRADIIYENPQNQIPKNNFYSNNTLRTFQSNINHSSDSHINLQKSDNVFNKSIPSNDIATKSKVLSKNSFINAPMNLEESLNQIVKSFLSLKSSKRNVYRKKKHTLPKFLNKKFRKNFISHLLNYKNSNRKNSFTISEMYRTFAEGYLRNNSLQSSVSTTQSSNLHFQKQRFSLKNYENNQVGKISLNKRSVILSTQPPSSANTYINTKNFSIFFSNNPQLFRTTQLRRFISETSSKTTKSILKSKDKKAGRFTSINPISNKVGGNITSNTIHHSDQALSHDIISSTSPIPNIFIENAEYINIPTKVNSSVSQTTKNLIKKKRDEVLETEKDIFAVYLKSLYHSTMVLTTVGNLPEPTTKFGFAFAIFEFVFALLLFAAILGHVANIVTSISAARKEFQGTLYKKL